MFDMAPILLYREFKATTPFVDAFVIERLRQLLPSTNNCLLQFSDRREASKFILSIFTNQNSFIRNRVIIKWRDLTSPFGNEKFTLVLKCTGQRAFDS